MTSTITAAALKIKITETINLNGVAQGATNTMSITGINEVSKKNNYYTNF